MVDAYLRQLNGQVEQLRKHLGLEWATCPKSYLLIEDWDKLPHAHPTCNGGELSDGYDKWPCDACDGAGEILKVKDGPGSSDSKEG